MAQNIFQRKSAKSLQSKNAPKTFSTQSFKSSPSYCKYSRAPSLYAVLEKLKRLDAIGNSLIFLNHIWESRPRIYITPPAFHFLLFLNRVRYWARIFKRLGSPGIDSNETIPQDCSPAGRYDNPFHTRFLAPIDCIKIPALYTVCTMHNKGRKLAQFWVHACLTLHSLQSLVLLFSLFMQEWARWIVCVCGGGGGGGVGMNNT